MTPAVIVGRYARIVEGLDELKIAAVWAAVLFGRNPVDSTLFAAVEQLRELRDAIGKSNAARRRDAA